VAGHEVVAEDDVRQVQVGRRRDLLPTLRDDPPGLLAAVPACRP